jgi:hypothetical protein
LIAAWICFAIVSCFAAFAAAQQRPSDQQAAAAPQSVQATHYITMPPGFSIRYESPRPFASVVPGNPKVADAVAGATDRVLVITSKTEGQTNFLLVDGGGQEVGNVVVTVSNRDSNKVVVHNKINNLAGFTNYVCDPICVRVADPMEGGDRVPLQNLSTQNQTITQTPVPAGPPPP